MICLAIEEAFTEQLVPLVLQDGAKEGQVHFRVVLNAPDVRPVGTERSRLYIGHLVECKDGRSGRQFANDVDVFCKRIERSESALHHRVRFTRGSDIDLPRDNRFPPARIPSHLATRHCGRQLQTEADCKYRHA